MRLTLRAVSLCACCALGPMLPMLPAHADGGLTLEGGAMQNARVPRGSAFYYRVDYQGMSLGEYGRAFAPTPDPNAAVARLLVPPRDSADVSVHLERGAVRAAGDVFSAAGIKPLGAALPALRRLRGTAQAFGSLDGTSTTYSLGLETPSFHAPEALRLGRASVANWLVVGAQAERRRRPGAVAEFRDASAIQARWFAGRGFGPRGHSARQLRELHEALAGVRRRASTYRQAEDINTDWRRHHRGEARPPVEAAIGGIVGGLEDELDDRPAAERDSLADDPAWWAEHVDQWGEATLPPDQPRAALWFDGYVRREYGAGRASDAALQLFRAQLQVWLSLADPEQGWITLAYVNGFDRALPRERRDQLLLTMGMSF